MSDAQTQQNNTPNRRRHGRRNGKPSGLKAYASENDAAYAQPARFNGPPTTPDRNTGARTSSGHHAAQGNNRQQTLTKPRFQNDPSSPEPNYIGGPPKSTPMHPVTYNAGSEPAFAGATFHASPAPSSLPMPSFLSRAAAETPPSGRMPEVTQQPSPPPTDNDVPTPSRQITNQRVDESPLDFMFRAHRREKEERGVETANFQTSSFGGSFSPSAAKQGTSTQTLAASPTQRPTVRRARSGIDREELDGMSTRATGPAFSTPYQDKLRAARSNIATVQEQEPSTMLEDPTEALKKFLFKPLSAQHDSPVKSLPNSVPSPARQPIMGMPAESSSQSPSIKAMENDLRRILKMDVKP